MVYPYITPVIAPAGEHYLPGIGGQLGRSVIIRDIDSGVKFPEILRDDAPGGPRESDEMLAAYRRIWRRPRGVGGRCGSCDVLRPHGGNEELARQRRVGSQPIHRAQR